MSRPTSEDIRRDRAIQAVEDGVRALGWRTTGYEAHITSAQISRLLDENGADIDRVIRLIDERLTAFNIPKPEDEEIDW